LDTSHKKIRILLLDDHTVFRQGLVNLMKNQPDLDLPLHCGSVCEALLMVGMGAPDIVVLDVNLGSERGIDFLAQARRKGFQGPVLVLTAAISRSEEELLRTYGIAGILRKDVSIEVLMQRIREVAQNQSQRHFVLPAAVSRNAVTGGKRQDWLTPREVEVLRLVLEGRPNKEIAHELSCSESAVKGIVQQLFHKSGTSTRSQLVRAALDKYRDQI
jgi:two-component system, NarL family, nitrate/nitrite response regulator NarL